MNPPIVLLERELVAVDAEVGEFYLQLNERLSGSPARDRRFAVELVAREAVQNAIDYGCAHDPTRRLRFSATIDGNVLKIVVADEGPGFDPDAALSRRTGREAGTSGNGLYLISAYSDTYHYENGGRMLIAEFVLGEAGAMQEATEQGSWAPRFDIVAAKAQTAKEELRALVGSSSGEFVVDLSEVRMIDSKGLGILIAAVNTLEVAGRTMRIIGANDDLIGLFRMMRLDRHLKLG